MRVAVASARALVGSARSYVYDTVGRFWAVLEAGHQPSFADRAALTGCFGHTVTSCRDAVELLADAVGTAAVRRDSPLERNLRDLITIGQHIVGKPLMRQWAGGLWFGNPRPCRSSERAADRVSPGRMRSGHGANRYPTTRDYPWVLQQTRPARI